jgi:uncharacterized delta-60 repeat protein
MAMFRIALAVFVFCVVVSTPARAQDGQLDPFFVPGYGYRLISYSGLASEDDTASTLLVQPDGRILFAVAFHATHNNPGIIEMTRASRDGGVDPGFTATQVQGLQIASGPASMALQSTGKILVLGQYFNNNPNDLVVFRYNADGSPDVNWGTNGRIDVPFTALSNVNVTAADVVVQSDDKVILTGTAAGAGGSAFIAIRLTANGGIDTSYGSGGQVVVTRFGQLLNGPPQELLRHARLTSKGTLILGGLTEPLYSGTPPFLALTSASVALTKLTTTGVLDTAFGDGGVVIYGVPNTIGAIDIAVTRNESVYALLGGVPSVLRFLKNGSADFNYGSFGLARFTPIDPITQMQTINTTHSLMLQQDGKVVVAGEADIGVDHEAMAARLLINGDPDPSFGTPNCGVGVFLQSSALASPAWEEADSITVQNGRVLLGGKIIVDASVGFNYIPIIYRLNGDRIFTDGLELLP